MRCYQCGKINERETKCSGCGAAFKETKVLFAFELDSETVQEYRKCCEKDDIVIEDGKLVRYAGSSKYIKIPDGVRVIGYGAFCKCGELEKIELHSEIEAIEFAAFAQCSTLTQIKLPESVLSIGYGAFAGCVNLRQIELSSRLQSIGDRVFEGCDNLERIEYGGSKKEWQQLTKNVQLGVLVDNKLYCNEPKKVDPMKVEKNKTVSQNPNLENNDFLIKNGVLVKYKGKKSKVIIPEGVTSIGNRAFMECGSLEQIEIPNSVTSVGSHVFWRCLRLKKIKISNSVESMGDNIFLGCLYLKDIYYTGTEEEWKHMTENTDIGVDQVKIHYDHFPKRKKTILDAHLNFENKEILMRNGEVVTYKGKESIVIIPEGVISIGDSAFKECNSLEQIKIPNSVRSIGDNAFDGCRSLKQIEIPNSVASIGDSAFKECNSLEQIEIPNSVTSIGDSAFKWCFSLEQIKIPDSVMSMGDDILGECDRLKDIYYTGTKEEWECMIKEADIGKLEQVNIHYNHFT